MSLSIAGELELDGLWSSFQPKWFCDSISTPSFRTAFVSALKHSTDYMHKFTWQALHGWNCGTKRIRKLSNTFYQWRSMLWKSVSTKNRKKARVRTILKSSVLNNRIGLFCFYTKAVKIPFVHTCYSKKGTKDFNQS